MSIFQNGAFLCGFDYLQNGSGGIAQFFDITGAGGATIDSSLTRFGVGQSIKISTE